METTVLFEKLLSYMYPDNEMVRACVIESMNQSKKDFLKVDGFDYFDDFKGLHSTSSNKNYLTVYSKIIKVNNLRINLYYITPKGVGRLDETISLDIDVPLVMEFKDGYMQNFAPVFTNRKDLDAFVDQINAWKNKYHNSKAWDDKIMEITRLAVYLHFNSASKEV